MDDIIFGSTNKFMCEKFAKMMQRKFNLSMIGKLSFFLRLQIRQTQDGIFIHQDKYTRELLKKFGMSNAKEVATCMASSTYLEKDKKGKDVSAKLYRSMIGSQLYLTAFRPDILFSVCKCAHFQLCSKESHLTTVKRILKYLAHSHKLGLWYPRHSIFVLIGYSDVYFADIKMDRKCTFGTCQLIRSMLIS